MSSVMFTNLRLLCLFFFNDPATTEIYTLSLHDALPICFSSTPVSFFPHENSTSVMPKDSADSNNFRISSSDGAVFPSDRKSTRLNSSHVEISYAVFCLKKKKKKTNSNFVK